MTPFSEHERPRSVWTTVGGLRVHARVLGPEDAAPVVLVHGLVVSGLYTVPTLKLLARTFRVYAPDLPGFGASEKPARPLDVGGLSEALAAWMRAVGLEGAALVGNSMGCQVVTELALRHPGPVRKVVLQGPTMDRRGRGAVRHVGRLLLDNLREPPSLLAVEVFDLLRADVVRSWRMFRYALDDPIEERLPGVGVPALVVHGSRDPISPRPWAEEVARLLPRGRLVVIPAAHAANFSAPADLAREIQAFLDEG